MCDTHQNERHLALRLTVLMNVLQNRDINVSSNIRTRHDSCSGVAAISTKEGIHICVFARYTSIVGISNPVTLREHHSGRSDELRDSSVALAVRDFMPFWGLTSLTKKLLAAAT